MRVDICMQVLSAPPKGVILLITTPLKGARNKPKILPLKLFSCLIIQKDVNIKDWR